MYIPIVFPATYTTPFDSTSAIKDSVNGHAFLVARKVTALRGRAGYAMGSGMAIAFIGVFVFGVIVRCVLRERRAREQARAHVEALAIQDREFWGIDRVTPRRRIRRQGEEYQEEGGEAGDQRQITKLQEQRERRERTHGRFDSILERIEKKALQEDGSNESAKVVEWLKEGSKDSNPVRALDDEKVDSESGNGDVVTAVVKPEPVYKAIRGSKSGMSLRHGI